MLAAKRIAKIGRQIRPVSIESVYRAADDVMKLDINSTARLNSGHEIPLLGYGVYQTPAEEAESVCNQAMKAGYRHIDSATAYRNEGPSVLGMLQAGIPREQIFFTSKVPPRSINYKDAKACISESLNKTGLDYLDLYLLHAPYGGKEGRIGAWQALVEGVKEGKIRSIGVSNYGVHHLQELEDWQKSQPEDKRGVLSINQVELHPWLARPDIVSWCKERGVVLEAYSPLVRATRMDDQRLQKIAKKHEKQPSHVLLRWGLQKGFVILPKSVTPKRIIDNTKLYDFELDTEDMKLLNMDEYSPSAWDPTTSKD